jgi:hypothetical protein
MKTTSMRAALYARYSSDEQKDRSIEDQWSLCQERAAREGFTIVAKFCDRKKTGTKMLNRDGLAELMAAAKAGKFDIVVAECLDRLSRDQEGLPGIYKRLTHYGLKIWTANEGWTTPMHIGVRGIVGSMAITDLADKITRAQGPLVMEGLFPGAVTYGYDRVRETGADGITTWKAGARVVNEEKAKVIRRIYREYAAGISPRDICAGLTKDNIPSPSGAKGWRHQSLTTGGAKACGILSNRIYIGEIVWGQHYTVKDPETERESRRARPANEHKVQQVAHLRIVDDELWQAVQALRKARATKKFGPSGKVVSRSVVTRSSDVLSGRLQCAVCQGRMIKVGIKRGRTYIACSAAFQRGSCAHARSYQLDTLQEGVLNGLRHRLGDPKSVKEAAKSFIEEYAELAKKSDGERIGEERELAKVTLKIERLVDLVSDGDIPMETAKEKLRALEAERVRRAERVKQLKAVCLTRVLRSDFLVEDYRKKVDQLHECLERDPHSTEGRIAFGDMVESVVVHPTDKGEDYKVSVYGKLSSLIGGELFPTLRSNEKIFADEALGGGDMPYADQSRESPDASGNASPFHLPRQRLFPWRGRRGRVLRMAQEPPRSHRP